jgi:hypothetical protein
MYTYPQLHPLPLLSAPLALPLGQPPNLTVPAFALINCVILRSCFASIPNSALGYADLSAAVLTGHPVEKRGFGNIQERPNRTAATGI